MNNKEFIAELAKQNNMEITDTQKMMNSMIGVMGEIFMEGNGVQLSNFGAFEVKKKLERVIVNPSTGLRLLVPPKLTLAFKPIQQVKEKIKKGGDDNA